MVLSEQFRDNAICIKFMSDMQIEDCGGPFLSKSILICRNSQDSDDVGIKQPLNLIVRFRKRMCTK